MDLPHLLSTAPFTAEQAAIAGVSKRQLAALVATRRVRRLFHTVYLDAQLVDSLDSRLNAVTVVLPDFGIVCDRTAAWLHGVDALEFQELELPPRLDVVVLPDYTRRRRPEVTPRVRELDDDDIMQLGPLRVTTPLRTALDLGCQLQRRAALAALDQFAHRHGITSKSLELELPRLRGRRGVVQLRELTPLLDPRAESPAESWVRMTMIDAGLPRPELQYSVMVDDVEKFRLDLAYPHHRICIEYDGQEFHTSSEHRREDAKRRDWLKADGWCVIVITKDDWTPNAIERWTSEIGTALATRQRPRSVRRFGLPRR